MFVELNCYIFCTFPHMTLARLNVRIQSISKSVHFRKNHLAAYSHSFIMNAIACGCVLRPGGVVDKVSFDLMVNCGY